MFVGGTTRIRDHLCDKCSPVQGNCEEFKSLKEKLLQDRELLAKQKSNKRRQAEVDFSMSTDSLDTTIDHGHRRRWQPD